MAKRGRPPKQFPLSPATKRARAAERQRYYRAGLKKPRPLPFPNDGEIHFIHYTPTPIQPEPRAFEPHNCCITQGLTSASPTIAPKRELSTLFPTDIMALPPASTDSTFTALETLITNSHPTHIDAASVLADTGSPSASIAILDHGTISSHVISTLPTNQRNTDTLYQACSISKPVTGLTIARLIEKKGLFTLDSKVVDLLPPEIIETMTADPRTRAAMSSVTVRMLMSHTAGLSVHGFPGYPVEQYPDHARGLPTAAQVIASSEGVNTGKVKVVAPPGLQFMYSGGGITVLHAIVERVTGKKFADVVKEEVLDQLGMDRSFYVLDNDGWEEGNLAEVWWTGNTKADTRYNVVPELAAGGLWTTPTDLLKMVRAVQGILRGEDGDERGQGFLTREFMQTVLTTVKFTMGLTWFCNEYAMGHGGGNWPGYKCMMFGWADLPWNRKDKNRKSKDKTTNNDTVSNVEVSLPEGCGIAVMTEAATGQDVLWKIIHAIAYLKGWPMPPAFFGEPENGAPFGLDGDVEADKNDDWKEWIGQWKDEGATSSWNILKDEEGRPAACIESGMVMRLRTAAMAPVRYVGGKQSIDLELDGMEVMLRLGWERETKKGQEAKRTVEVCHHPSSTTTVLYEVGV